MSNERDDRGQQGREVPARGEPARVVPISHRRGAMHELLHGPGPGRPAGGTPGGQARPPASPRIPRRTAFTLPLRPLLRVVSEPSPAAPGPRLDEAPTVPSRRWAARRERRAFAAASAGVIALAALCALAIRLAIAPADVVLAPETGGPVPGMTAPPASVVAASSSSATVAPAPARAPATRRPDPITQAEGLEAEGARALVRGDLEAAARAYERASALTPAKPEIWRRLGLIQEQRGRPGAAVAAYRRYLAIAPPGAAAGAIAQRIQRLELLGR